MASSPALHKLLRKNLSMDEKVAKASGSVRALSVYLWKTAKAMYLSKDCVLLSPEDFNSLPIELHLLDLAGPCPTKFLEPIPLATLQQWLDTTRPWESRGKGWGEEHHRENMAWWNANSLANDLTAYTSESYDDDVSGCIYEYTSWSRRLSSPFKIARKKVWYNVEAVYDCKDGNGSIFPHATCIISQDVLLEEDRVSAYEIYTLSMLAYMRMKDGFRKTAAIPLTMISLGGPRCRILHGYFDVNNGCLVLYKSPIYFFDKRFRCMEDDFQRVLSWIMAKPLPC